jgi:hypothetical protein
MNLITSIKYDMMPQNVVLSMGEPTDHPYFADYAIHLADSLPGLHFFIESNGLWIESDEQCEDMRRVLRLPQTQLVRISSHHKHYQRYYEFMKVVDKITAFGQEVAKELDPTKPINKIMVDTNYLDISPVVNLGRAKEKHIKTSKKVMEKFIKQGITPPCYFPILLALETHSFAEWLVSMEHRGHYLHPIITAEGDVVIGLVNACYGVGNICIHTPEQVYQVIKKIDLSCDECGLNQYIPEKTKLYMEQLRKYGPPDLNPVYDPRGSAVPTWTKKE